MIFSFSFWFCLWYYRGSYMDLVCISGRNSLYQNNYFKLAIHNNLNAAWILIHTFIRIHFMTLLLFCRWWRLGVFLAPFWAWWYTFPSIQPILGAFECLFVVRKLFKLLLIIEIERILLTTTLINDASPISVFMCTPLWQNWVFLYGLIISLLRGLSLYCIHIYIYMIWSGRILANVSW